ncbi:restriction endonuclease, partial [bacterium (Candidatus Howlettbacteria) CG_4_10_14_0_8_um_filter_40_9]
FELSEKEVAQGIVGDPDKAFVFPHNQEFNKDESKVLFKYFTSVGKYHSGEQRGLLAYLNKEVISIEHYSTIKSQLEIYTPQLTDRREVKNGRIKWFHLHWSRDKKYFKKGPKIISAIRTRCPSCFYTEEEYYGSRALNFIKSDRINLKYLTGLLNSRLSYFWLKNKGKQLGDLLQIDKGPLLGIPLHKSEEKLQNKIAVLVDEIIRLNKDLSEAKMNTDKSEKLNQEIEKVDKKINDEVYKLYDLTEEEIKIIEDV